LRFENIHDMKNYKSVSKTMTYISAVVIIFIAGTLFSLEHKFFIAIGVIFSLIAAIAFIASLRQDVISINLENNKCLVEYFLSTKTYAYKEISNIEIVYRPFHLKDVINIDVLPYGKRITCFTSNPLELFFEVTRNLPNFENFTNEEIFHNLNQYDQETIMAIFRQRY